MTTYRVTIDLDNDTLAALKNGFQMQVYKGVKTSSPSGALPTVWFDVNKFANTVTVSWEEEFGGYFSNSQVRNGVVVDISTQQPMNPKDVITLSDTGSASVNTIGGVDGAFSFKSDQPTEWTSGLLSKNSNGKFAPICAFPQYGAVGNIIAPYEKILILFTQEQLDTGAVVETAVSRSVSIIMSTIAPTANVGFSINKGWDTKGNPQVKENAQNFLLAPDLIIPSATMNNILKDSTRKSKSEALKVLAEV
jgi:hypothetical protein